MKTYPSDYLDIATQVIQAWRQIDETIQFGGISLSDLEADITLANSLQNQIIALETQLTNLRNHRDETRSNLWTKTKKVRTSVKGMYGDDSSEYEMMGGTRMSERKSSTKKPKTEA